MSGEGGAGAGSGLGWGSGGGTSEPSILRGIAYIAFLLQREIQTASGPKALASVEPGLAHGTPRPPPPRVPAGATGLLQTRASAAGKGGCSRLGPQLLTSRRPRRLFPPPAPFTSGPRLPSPPPPISLPTNLGTQTPESGRGGEGGERPRGSRSPAANPPPVLGSPSSRKWRMERPWSPRLPGR